MNHEPLGGLVAATLTPMRADGSVNLPAIGPMVELLLRNGISGLYICGSTGEGVSLSTGERKAVTAEFVKAAAGRVPVIAQVGHNSLAEASDLAADAAATGVDIISATCPSYFKANNNERLAECIEPIAAAAGDKPFYYYHIPSLTGSTVDIVRFLETGQERIPNLVGLKYTDSRLHEFQACQAVCDGAFDIVWGTDEMLLAALATGANAAIGSTYNITAPLSNSIIEAFRSGDIATARAKQLQSVQFIRALLTLPFHAAVKRTFGRFGSELGPVRPPLQNLTAANTAVLDELLDQSAFDTFGCH